MAEERDRLRTTFDEAASLYDEGRPGCPEDLFAPQEVDGSPRSDGHGPTDGQDVARKSERLAAGAPGGRSTRLGGYDCAYPGADFVTVCAARRGLLLGWISDGRVVENANASIV